KPELGKRFPPIEGVFGNIEIKRVSNAGKDRLPRFTLWYVVAKRMLIANLVIAISPKRDSNSMARLQAVQLAAQCAWAKKFPYGFFGEGSTGLGQMHKHKLWSYKHG